MKGAAHPVLGWMTACMHHLRKDKCYYHPVSEASSITALPGGGVFLFVWVCSFVLNKSGCYTPLPIYVMVRIIKLGMLEKHFDLILTRPCEHVLSLPTVSPTKHPEDVLCPTRPLWACLCVLQCMGTEHSLEATTSHPCLRNDCVWFPEDASLDIAQLVRQNSEQL